MHYLLVLNVLRDLLLPTYTLWINFTGNKEYAIGIITTTTERVFVSTNNSPNRAPHVIRVSFRPL